MTVEKGQKQNDEEERKKGDEEENGEGGEDEEDEEDEEDDEEDGDNRVSGSVREVLSVGKCGFPLEKNGGAGFGGGGMVVEKNGGGGGSPLSQTNGKKEPTIGQMIKKVGREINDMLQN